MTTVAAKPIGNRDQYQILLRYARGMELPAIAAETDLALELVAGTVQHIANSNRNYARTLVDDYERTRRAATPPPAVAAPAAREDRDPIEALLTKAEQSGDRQLVNLAGRARTLLGDIAGRHARLADEIEAAAEVAKARAELAAAEAKLRKVRTTSAPVKPPGAVRERYARIRKWAADNGHDLRPIGRIPGPVVAAYEAATGDAG